MAPGQTDHENWNHDIFFSLSYFISIAHQQNTKLSTWKKHPAMAVNMVGSVTAAKALLAKLVKAGYKITNLKDLQSQLQDIRIRPDADVKK